MSKSVLISIRPEWVELIVSGKKTIEVRKSRPKLEPPFTCYIYCTKGKDLWLAGVIGKREAAKLNGKVIGEFVCNAMFPISFYASDAAFFDTEPPLDVPGTCLTDREIVEYLGNGKTGYGWNISDLKIYDEPKLISDFKRWNRTEENSPCAHTKALYEPCDSCKECNLKAAPQSWCFVEELREELHNMNLK